MDAKEIKSLRKQLGLNQKDFSERINVSMVTISKWERELAFPRKKHMTTLRTIQQERSQNSVEAYRPIQYLGSKVRLLGDIRKLVESYSQGDNVCDLFSGSGVVSSHLSSNYKLIATDIQEYSFELTRSLLDNKHLDDSQLSEVIEFIEMPSHYRDALELSKDLINYEKKCLDKACKGNPEDLVNFSKESSLYIHQNKVNKSKKTLLCKLKGSFSNDHDSSKLIVSNLYGGVYFSYEQAVYIDVIRQLIRSNDNWSESIKNLVLSALISTASDITNTVGKQFAQPMKLLNKNNEPKQLLIERTLRDKRYSVLKVLKQAIKKMNHARQHVSSKNHEVFCGDSLDFLSSYEGEINCFYADPPYTIDHYSRFYHVLETISKYDKPKLATMNKKGVTTIMNGLYRVDRHQSSFCIPSRVKNAFIKLIQGCAAHKAPLIISYSPYDNSNSERPRLLKTEEIMEIANKYYKSVDIKTADGHIHRKLHSTNKNSTDISNGEVFIICSGAII